MKPFELGYLLDLVPPDVRDECARALEAGRAIAEGRELTGDQANRAPAHAVPAARTAIPVHPETPPQWYREELARLARGDRQAVNRQERRALAVATRLAEGRTEEARREAYRQRQRVHQRAHRRRWHYLRQPEAPEGLAIGRAATAQQFVAARSAIADEWGCRSAVAAFPVRVAQRFIEWVRELGPCDAYGSPWSSRLVRKTVATYAAIIYAARPSWREGYALVTTGFGRERLAGIIGPAPESGRRYSVGALSHVELGSLAVLERMGVLERVQVPGDAVPGCDRGGAYAFNHYLIPGELVPSADEWGRPAKVNPGLPAELAAEVCPWLALPDGAHVKLAHVRAAALASALDRLVQREGVTEPAELEGLDLAELPPAEPADPPDR